MVRHFSEALGSTHKAFQRAGVFDGFVEVDTKLYIDPHLLGVSSEPEIKEASAGLRAYFEEIIRLLQNVQSTGSVFWRTAYRRLIFKENPALSLGYSYDDTHGSAIGEKLGRAITNTALEIVRAGITDPEIFELVGLLEDGIGADRISDMTAAIALPHLYAYSQRIGKRLRLTTREHRFRGVNYSLPFDKRKRRFVVLVPTDILRELPVAHDWSQIDVVCSHNRELRDRVNGLIGDTWRHATRYVPKRELRETLLRYPGAMQDLVDQYRNKKGQPYDFEKDPRGEMSWFDTAQRYAKRYPLRLARFGRATRDNLSDIVAEICRKFQQLVENNGLSEVFYDSGRKLKHERAAQLVFYGVADAYCEANDLDISRESNAGRGPVDFKISRGYSAKVNVEVKHSSNSHLVDGYNNQLPAYNAAEQATSSVYLIIKTGNHKRKIDQVLEAQANARQSNRRAPEVIVIDAQRKSSASNIRSIRRNR